MKVSKPQFTCLWDQCRERSFLIEILSFYDSRISIWKFFSLLLTNLLRGLQSCIFSFQMIFLKKNILLERILSFINIFWNWVKNYWTSAKRTSLGLTKFGSTCPKEHSESKKNFMENVPFSKHVRTSNKKKFSFFRKHFGCLVKTVFIISVGTFRRKNLSRKKMIFFYLSSCSDIESKFFGLVPKKIQWVCQNCKLRVCGTSVEKGKFLEEIMSFYHILTSS